MKTLRFLPFVLSASSLHAQDTFSVSWSAMTGGGTASSGAGEFTLPGSIGQAAPGDPTPKAASEFSLTGGYWTMEEAPMEIGLAMVTTNGVVTLTWDGARGVPVVLEVSADLKQWTPVPVQPAGPIFTEPASMRRYYRLRRSQP